MGLRSGETASGRRRLGLFPTIPRGSGLSAVTSLEKDVTADAK